MFKKILLLTAVILTGAVVALALCVRPAPEKVIKEMTANLPESFQADFRAELSALNLEGDFSLKETGLAAFQVKLKGSEREFLLAGEWQALEGRSFIKLTVLPDLPLLDLFFREMGIDLSQAENQWLELDPEFFGGFPETLGGELKKLIAKEDFYSVEEELKSGKEDYRYSVNFNDAEIESLVRRFWPGSVTALGGELRVGKKNLTLSRLTGDVEINLGQEEGILKVGFEVIPLY